MQLSVVRTALTSSSVMQSVRKDSIRYFRTTAVNQMNHVNPTNRKKQTVLLVATGSFFVLTMLARQMWASDPSTGRHMFK